MVRAIYAKKVVVDRVAEPVGDSWGCKVCQTLPRGHKDEGAKRTKSVEILSREADKQSNMV